MSIKMKLTLVLVHLQKNPKKQHHYLMMNMIAVINLTVLKKKLQFSDSFKEETFNKSMAEIASNYCSPVKYLLRTNLNVSERTKKRII